MNASFYTRNNTYLGSVNLSVMLKPGFKLNYRNQQYVVLAVYQLPEQMNTKAYNVILDPVASRWEISE